MTPPLRGTRLDETYSPKTEGENGENCMTLTSTVFDSYTRVTDGRTIAYSVLTAQNICCRALIIDSNDYDDIIMLMISDV